MYQISITRWMMMCLAVALLWAPAQAQSAKPFTLSEEDRLALEQAVDRGEEIYYRDAAAWVATDALLKQISREKFRELGVVGWVTMPLTDEESGTFPILYEVSFLTEQDGDYRKLFVAELEGWDIVSEHLFLEAEARPRLNIEEIQAFRAKWVAAASMTAEHWCSGPFNTVVIPTETGHDVYLLSPETETGQVQIGGHYKVSVDKTQKITGVYKFSNSCLSLEREPMVVALWITDPLHPFPAETHVFKSLSHEAAIFVMTTSNDQLWAVEGVSIRWVEQDVED